MMFGMLEEKNEDNNKNNNDSESLLSSFETSYDENINTQMFDLNNPQNLIDKMQQNISNENKSLNNVSNQNYNMNTNQVQQPNINQPMYPINNQVYPQNNYQNPNNNYIIQSKQELSIINNEPISQAIEKNIQTEDVNQNSIIPNIIAEQQSQNEIETRNYSNPIIKNIIPDVTNLNTGSIDGIITSNIDDIDNFEQDNILMPNNSYINNNIQEQPILNHIPTLTDISKNNNKITDFTSSLIGIPIDINKENSESNIIETPIANNSIINSKPDVIINNVHDNYVEDSSYENINNDNQTLYDERYEDETATEPIHNHQDEKFTINDNINVEPGFKVCPKCGQMIREDYRLCFVCGTYF